MKTLGLETCGQGRARLILATHVRMTALRRGKPMSNPSGGETPLQKRHKFDPVGGDFPNTCRRCAEFSDSITHQINPSIVEMCTCGHGRGSHHACWYLEECGCTEFQPSGVTGEVCICSLGNNSALCPKHPWRRAGEIIQGLPANIFESRVNMAEAHCQELPSARPAEGETDEIPYAPFPAKVAYSVESYPVGTLAAKDAEIARLKEEHESFVVNFTHANEIERGEHAHEVEHLRGLLRRAKSFLDERGSDHRLDELRNRIEETLR